MLVGLIGRPTLPYDVKMVAEEQPQHNRNYCTEDDHGREKVELMLKEADDDHRCSLQFLFIECEDLLKQTLLLGICHENVVP